jgi:hypothetical protein
VDGERITLRPTLRAALRLERRHGGFDRLVGAIADGNLAVLADVIRESAEGFTSLPDLLECISKGGLKRGLEAIQAPVLAHVFALAGYDEHHTVLNDENDQAKGQKITFADHHRKLFEIATGWLGWSPAQAWDSTPAEIMAAYNGRLDMLKAIFGSQEDKQADVPFDDQALRFVASVNSAFAGRT